MTSGWVGWGISTRGVAFMLKICAVLIKLLTHYKIMIDCFGYWQSIGTDSAMYISLTKVNHQVMQQLGLVQK